MAPSTPKHHKVIIVGAGFHGIVAAKTYLQVKPSTDLLVIDNNSSLGGVWSKDRVYPGLLYEAPCPLANFSDFDMVKELGMEMWETISGPQVNEFLTRYAEKHDIPKFCRFNLQATSVGRNGNGWKVTVKSTQDEKATNEVFTCDKLIMTTGITSTPKPAPMDLSKFEGISFHAINMGKRHQDLLTDDIKHITVIGGHKSALEAVGTCAQAGKNVEWLIRAEGGGPTWMMPAKAPDGSSLAKMTTKRFMGFASTSIYHSDRWLNRFMFSGRWWLGTWFVNWFWAFMTKTILTDAIAKKERYSKSDNGGKLRPAPESMFWFTPGGTILQDRDLKTWELIDEGKVINVTRSHIVSVQGHSITLSNGDRIQTDAIVYCTGWDVAYPNLFSPSLCAELGLPFDPITVSTPQTQYWEKLDAAAEKSLLNEYPILANPPSNIHVPSSRRTPFRLFRAMIPSKLAATGDNSLAIIGNYANGRVQLSGEINSLWAVAYLEGLMPSPTKALLTDEEAMNRDIAKLEVYRQKRYLSCQAFRLTLFESPEIDDLVLEDLGVRSDRKRMRIPDGWKGWFGWKAWAEEWFGSYLAADYEGVVEEFLESVRQRGVVGERTPLVNVVK